MNVVPVTLLLAVVAAMTVVVAVSVAFAIAIAVDAASDVVDPLGWTRRFMCQRLPTFSWLTRSWTGIYSRGSYRWNICFPHIIRKACRVPSLIQPCERPQTRRYPESDPSYLKRM